MEVNWEHNRTTGCINDKLIAITTPSVKNTFYFGWGRGEGGGEERCREGGRGEINIKPVTANYTVQLLAIITYFNSSTIPPFFLKAYFLYPFILLLFHSLFCFVFSVTFGMTNSTMYYYTKVMRGLFCLIILLCICCGSILSLV